MTLSSRSPKDQPVLDEGSFQQLLAAAYVVQEYSTVAPAQGAASTSQVLSVIAEIQSLIRTSSLNVTDSAAVIAERVLGLTGADGVSISLVDNGYLDCVAEAGTPAQVPGRCIASHSLVATERLRAGSIFESSDSQNDFRLDMDLCRGAGVGSLVAAPVSRFGEIAGLIEARWRGSRGFSENEARTCRLMAGLVTGTLERSLRISKAHSPGAEQWPVQPEKAEDSTTARVADEVPAAKGEVSHGELEPPSAPPLAVPVVPDNESETVDSVGSELVPACRMCGRAFLGHELFCGFCSMPRPAKSPSTEIQSKWAEMWFMQRAQGALEDDVEEDTVALEPELASEPSEAVLRPAEPNVITRILNAQREEEVRESAPVRAEYQEEAPAAARIESGVREISFPLDDKAPFLDRVLDFGKGHWRDAVLATVVLALAYGLFSAWPKPGAKPTWFQSLMTSWGVTHPAGQAPVFAGRPEARVWLDAHTQLYYCQGDDLFGKTPDGDFTTQYNAQSEGYQPASTFVCP